MKAIILAAGMGKRLKGAGEGLPKALQKANGRALISYVIDNINFIKKKDICVVIGYMGEKIKAELGPEFSYAIQAEQKGTGHAVECARDFLTGYEGDVLALYGDMPLFRRETYSGLIQSHEKSGADCTLLTAVTDRVMPYGRVLRDSDGNYQAVVEDRDCTPEQKNIKELNLGVYAFKASKLLKYLSQVKNENAQGEYYLTDVPGIMQAAGCKINIFSIYEDDEIIGVNTQEDLMTCEKILKGRG